MKRPKCNTVMKRGLPVLVLVILLFSLSGGRVFGQTDPPAIQGNLKLLALEGTPYERGVQHGKALREEIHALVTLWKEDLRRAHKIDADVFIKRFLAHTEYQKAIREWTPELWDEVEGISEGSGIDFDTVFAFQLVDEMWVLGRDIMADKCTTIGFSGSESHPAMVAQTLDIPTFYHGFQTLLHHKDPAHETESFLFTFPGFIAANGINNHSVAVVVNAVQQLGNSTNGLPVAFVIRGILQRKTFADAVKFIKSIKHGAPQNYMIGGVGEVGSFECSTTHVSRFIPFAGASFTYHTNHPLENRNYTLGFSHYLKSKNISPDDYEYPCPRFRALQGIFSDNSVLVSVKMLKDIFNDRDTNINNRGTFGCTIMVLGENPELHISPGRPDKEPYQVFRFKSLR